MMSREMRTPDKMTIGELSVEVLHNLVHVQTYALAHARATGAKDKALARQLARAIEALTIAWTSEEDASADLATAIGEFAGSIMKVVGQRTQLPPLDQFRLRGLQIRFAIATALQRKSRPTAREFAESLKGMRDVLSATAIFPRMTDSTVSDWETKIGQLLKRYGRESPDDLAERIVRGCAKIAGHKKPSRIFKKTA